MPYKDPEKQKQYQREWWLEKKIKTPSIIKDINEKRSVRSRKARAFVKRILRMGCCVDCGFDDIRALEFDHVRGVKEFNIGRGVHYGYPISVIKDEIRKCRIRCSNCHRIKSHETNWASCVPRKPAVDVQRRGD